ncbi:MAG: pyruvate kinase [Myxococcales bacterium]|nr:pyruvate kinase [Myxococcales bacterium]
MLDVVQRTKPLRPTSVTQIHAVATALSHELRRLETRLVDLETRMASAIERVPAERRESARNLIHYVALRQHDLRDLQLQLSQHGLSSLGRSEAFVMGNVVEVSLRVQETLALLDGKGALRELRRLARVRKGALDWDGAKAYLHRHTREMLGPRPDDRHIYVMVTAPSAREADRAWMARMLESGMNVLRVNCAHEDEAHWDQVIRALDEAKRTTGKECRVLMDLAGPKIRTGQVGGARTATWKPTRDELGAVTTPARVIVRRASAPPIEAEGPVLLVEDALFAQVRKGDVLALRDVRDKRRKLPVVEIDGEQGQLVATADKRAYLLGKSRVSVLRGDELVAEGELVIGGASDAAIDVRIGDPLLLTGRDVPGKAPRRDADGRVLRAGTIACTLPAALDHLAVDHRVLFDDGRIEAVVQKVSAEQRDYRLRVVRTQRPIAKLRAEKGINLPDTHTTVPSLTAEDKKAIKFVAKRADLVGLSFVRGPEDVRVLHEVLDKHGRPDIGVVLKIETRAGFENLPRILLEGLVRPPLAVMIARGDLAVEVGFERLAELQEEILWLCEAAHLPAIWATQVLDTLARTGVPSRAEVTDAAASVAAECVMLNKGPYVDHAVRVLSDILRRMEKHRYKKRSLFRKLRVSTLVTP